MLALVLVAVSACLAAPGALVEDVPVKEVPYGETGVLICRSNDRKHLFSYWHVKNTNTVIGPSNWYDGAKFKCDMLSGNLTVRGVSQHDEGMYECVSRGLETDNINIRGVQLRVAQDWDQLYEHDPNINTIRVLVALIVLVMLSGVGYFAYRIWKDRYRYPSYLPEEDEDDDSGEEIFTAPGPSGVNTKASPPKSSKDSGSEFDNVDISTDFKSILETANNK